MRGTRTRNCPRTWRGMTSSIERPRKCWSATRHASRGRERRTGSRRRGFSRTRRPRAHGAWAFAVEENCASKLACGWAYGPLRMTATGSRLADFLDVDLLVAAEGATGVVAGAGGEGDEVAGDLQLSNFLRDEAEGAELGIVAEELPDNGDGGDAGGERGSVVEGD